MNPILRLISLNLLIFAYPILTLSQRPLKKIVYFYDSNPLRSARPQLDTAEANPITEIVPAEFFANPARDASKLRLEEDIDILAPTGGHSDADQEHRRTLWNQDIHQIKNSILDKMLQQKNKVKVVLLTSCFSGTLIPEFSQILTADGIILGHALTSANHYFVNTSLPQQNDAARIENIMNEIRQINNNAKPIDFSWLSEQGSLLYSQTATTLAVKLFFELSQKIALLTLPAEEKARLQKNLLSLTNQQINFKISDFITMDEVNSPIDTKTYPFLPQIADNLSRHDNNKLLKITDETGTAQISTKIPCQTNKEGDCCIEKADNEICANSALLTPGNFEFNIFSSEENMEKFLEILKAVNLTHIPQQFVMYDNKTKTLYYDKNFTPEATSSLAPYLSNTGNSSLQKDFTDTFLQNLKNGIKENNLEITIQAVPADELLKKIEENLKRLIS